MQDDAYRALPFPPSIPRQSNRNQKATEIHWNPPNSVKRDDPSTPTPGVTLDDVSPMKTRRLLPPSRRLDDGDDEVGAESPPKVVRQNRIQTPRPALDFLAENAGEHSGNMTLEANRQRARNAPLEAPVSEDRISESMEDTDTFEQLDDTIHTSGRASFLNRIESARSMTSRSMASNSTQAELDFYMHRQHDSSYKMMPPQWIGSSGETSTSPSQHAVVQRRRVMLAKSAAMLRSNFPGWDRTESMRSFCSQASSVAWSLGGSTIGGSTIGGSTIGGISRASCKSCQSPNTESKQSRTPTPTPPDHVRMTSSGTTGKPRQMVTNNPVVEHAHRPVPAMPPTSEVRATTPAPRAAATNEDLQYMRIKNDAVVREAKVSKPGNLLEDDDDIARDLWLMANKLSVDVEPSSDMGGNAPEEEHDSADDPTVVALGGPWHPQAGGSFTLYRRGD